MESNYEALVEACARDDRRAQQQLYQMCFPFLVRISRRYAKDNEEAVDLLNLAFVKIIQNLKSFQDQTHFESWAKRVTITVCIDEYRKQKRHTSRFVATEDEKLTYYDNEKSENEGFANLKADDIMKLIQQLPGLTKEVLNLVAIDGYSHQESGNLLGITEAASRWHLHRARQIMKEKMENLHKISSNHTS